jgi:hypothetical protein
MFGMLVYLSLSNPVSIGGLQTVNLETQLDIYPAISAYIIAWSINIKIIEYQLNPIRSDQNCFRQADSRCHIPRIHQTLSYTISIKHHKIIP